MSGIENLTLLPDLIYCHPELDVALIELEVPYDDQFCCKLDLDKYNFQGKIIDYFGINSRNTNRDLSENISVGILDQAKQGYMFHDRVKKGFSGGPVSLHKQNKVLGVISQRSKEDNETLFIPIYKFKDWLTPYLAKNENNPEPLVSLSSGKLKQIAQSGVSSLSKGGLRESGASEKQSLTNRQKLTKKIVEQFKLLNNISVLWEYANKVGFDFSKQNLEDFADFLVNRQEEGEIRLEAIRKFLNVAHNHIKQDNLIEPMYLVFECLLQTLVCPFPINQQGLTKIPVKRMPTLELVNAARLELPLTPEYDKEDLDFQSGKRISEGGNLCRFFPPTGLDDPDEVCLALANETAETICLENAIEFKAFKDFDGFETLNAILDQLNSNSESPVPYAISIHEEQRAKEQFGVDGVAKKFQEKTKNKIPLFWYGFNSDTESDRILHTAEVTICSIVIVGNKLREKYLKIIKKMPPPETPQQKPTENPNMSTSGNNFSNITNSTIIFGKQTDNQIGDANIKFAETDPRKLQELIKQLKTEAKQDNTIDEQKITAINMVANEIETEAFKPEDANKSVLAKAYEALSGFKDVASLAEIIKEIGQQLLPIIS
jgi:hypothetical protein